MPPTSPPVSRRKYRDKPLKYHRDVDLDGKAVVYVAISNHPGKVAKLFDEDFDRLLRNGYDHGFYLSSNGNGKSYLVVNEGRRRGEASKRKRQIARLIVPAPRRNQIRFVDEDPLNLRQDNLTILRRPIPEEPSSHN